MRESYSLSIVGPPGSGKTRFALLGTPRPLWLVYMDPNTRAVYRKLKAQNPDLVRGIVRKQIVPPALAFDDRDDVKEEAQEKWDLFRDHLRPLVKGEREAKAVAFDTATELYTLG